MILAQTTKKVSGLIIQKKIVRRNPQNVSKTKKKKKMKINARGNGKKPRRPAQWQNVRRRQRGAAKHTTSPDRGTTNFHKHTKTLKLLRKQKPKLNLC